MPVIEKFRGRVVWDGVVEVFRLYGQPNAVLCYAWSHKEGSGSRAVAVLEIPPVDSPVTAVRAAIVADSKNGPN